MFNEQLVAARAIQSACALDWPKDKLEVQVLDDSSEERARAIVDEAVAVQQSLGMNCYVVRREERTGYKAGALEHARKLTTAPYLALFDADFVPQASFLLAILPHFYTKQGELLEDLALVQAQWGHLNPCCSSITMAQSLWIDDHHTLQMNWRAAAYGFVNFTGTAGVWRNQAIDDAGGWSGSCLVEDCELSFRVLFTGYRTTFARELVPAELPASFAAYRAQQRRWTMGWAQLIRLHAQQLLLSYPCGPVKRCHLLYQMFLSVQWPLWMLWQLMLPFLFYTKMRAHWAGLYVYPPMAYMLAMSLFTSVEAVARESRAAAEADGKWRRRLRLIGVFLSSLSRVVPCMLISSGMLVHQACAWVEGLLTEHGVFERTPKTGVICQSARATLLTVTTPPSAPKRRYVVVGVEVCFVFYLLFWAFANDRWLEGHVSSTLGVLYQALTVSWVCIRSTFPALDEGPVSAWWRFAPSREQVVNALKKTGAAASPAMAFSYFTRCRRGWYKVRVVETSSLYDPLNASGDSVVIRP